MDLKNILKYPKGNHSESFNKQAEELMLGYCVRKEIDSKTVAKYYINELELYYYNKDHTDTYVHPHFFKDAGLFRVHYSGVDITFAADWKDKEEDARKLFKRGNKIRFEKNPSIDFKTLKSIITQNDISYGGLLLRELQPFDENSSYLPIVGPWCVLTELFYMNGSSLKLIIEPCNRRKSFEIDARERKGLGDKSGDEAKIYKAAKYNYYIKAI